MKNGACVTCGAEDVYRIRGIGHRAVVPAASIFNMPVIWAYICCSCGYMEEYVDEKDDKYFQRLREKGEKVCAIRR